MNRSLILVRSVKLHTMFKYIIIVPIQKILN